MGILCDTLMNHWSRSKIAKVFIHQEVSVAQMRTVPAFEIISQFIRTRRWQCKD